MAFSLLTDDQVRTEVKSLVHAGKVAWTRHSEEKMAERGIDKGQVKECLENGSFTERPTVPNRFGSIEYKFRMESIVDGETLAVAASLIPDSKVVVITVFAPN